MLKITISFYNNDLYIFTCKNEYVICNQNYDTILLLNNQLETQKTIQFQEELSFSNLYVTGHNEFIWGIASAPEDNALLYFDFETGYSKILLSKKMFLPFFYVESNSILVLIDNNKNFYRFDKVKMECIPISKNLVDAKFQKLLWMYQAYKPLAISSQDQSLFFEKNESIFFYQSTFDRICFIAPAKAEFINICRVGRSFIVATEYAVYLLTKKGDKVIVEATPGEYFHAIAAHSLNTFILLVANEANQRINRLELHQI